MSWNSGSQLTIVPSDRAGHSSTVSATLLWKLAWVTSTPFGSPVEPEVYCSTAMSSGRGGGKVRSPAGKSAIASVSSRVSPASSGGSPSWSSRRTAAVVRIVVVPASSAMRRTRCRATRRVGTGTGTPTTPAVMQPSRVATNSRPDG
nr:hypothetical protein [Actinoplanes awajinensis]